MNIDLAREKFNNLTENKIPFIFIFDFEMKNPIICEVDNCSEQGIFFDIEGRTNFEYSQKKNIKLEHEPIKYSIYKKAFKNVQANLKAGNSFLTNLTFKTPVKTDASLRDIFNSSKAKYKLLYKNDFTFFSPESFVKIDGQKISTFPMKGTIDEAVKNAEQKILQSKKELFEHTTIVDLMRNDLSMVARNVQVKKFRFVEQVKAADKSLLQISSCVEGDLDGGALFDTIACMLPAGSISGAPKFKTCQIIKESEADSRGYYTGVFGIFDGETLNSAVNIRFIENQNGQLFYRSGGGITSSSNMKSEYKELNSKIYIPVE